MFYVYDCYEKIVGNPSGYRTMRGASRLCNSRRVKGSLYDILWDTYEYAKAFDDKLTQVWSIKPKGEL
jgi:hypothetical protein